jgi:hypothetical protein
VLVYKEGHSIWRRVLLHKETLVCKEGSLYILLKQCAFIILWRRAAVCKEGPLIK